MRNMQFIKPVLLLIVISIIACNNQQQKKKAETGDKKHEIKEVFVPDFNADTAYYFVKKQLEFGPRVPNTASHAETAKYLASTLERFAPEVQVQEFKMRAFNRQVLNGKNIIASFNPEKKSRVLLCAHWDTRPFADHDPDPANFNNPIPGANDGASGVAVLLEIARQMKINPPDIGIDIILFDLEDYGEPESMQSSNHNHWALGSQYWSRNPHVINYRAKYGILLDMVGDKNAVFPKEGYSVYYAASIVDKVWNIAWEIGYDQYFINKEGAPIVDDHYFINTIANIPTIDIIHRDESNPKGFFKHWHTMQDDIENISPDVLKAVGQVVLTTVYRE